MSRKKRGVAVQEQEAVAQESVAQVLQEAGLENVLHAVVADVAQVVAEPEMSVAEAVQVTKATLIERRAAKKRRPWGAEARLALSAKLRARFADPELRKQLSQKIKAGWDDAAKARHAEKMKVVLNRPEVKERMREGMARFWKEFRETRAQMSDVEQQ